MMYKHEFEREVDRLWAIQKRNDPHTDPLVWWMTIEKEKPHLRYRKRSHIDLWQVVKSRLR